jgi:crotonobetainyl-CoA:carnitine CoA-transferase CaiB-like acyl-CoA transferase
MQSGLLRNAARAGLHLVFPPRCISCGDPVDADFALCGACWRDTPFIGGLVCDRCGLPLPGADEGRAEYCDDCLTIARPWDRGRAALLYRDRSGQGQFIDAAMHEACSSTTEVGLPSWLTRRTNVVRQTGRHAAAQRTEPWLHMANDGQYTLIFGIGRDNATWTKIKRWFQESGFGMQLDEARFDDPAARQPGRGSPEAAEVMRELSGFIAAHTASEVYRGGQERRQSWGIVRAPSEALDDPHWQYRGFWVETTGEGRETPVRMPGAPYQFSATPWALRRPAPKLGEHTAEVLAEWLG